jgi:uncharacterized protein (DUF2147 family)
MPRYRLLILCLLAFSALAGQAQPAITGKWKTIDDESGKEKSVIEIFERDGKFFGKVVKILDIHRDPDPVCDKCPADDARFKKKIIGMEIMRDLKREDDAYTGGDILDPEAGKVYRCKIWLEGDDLMVRGFWGPFYRTQTWKKFR